MSSVKVSIKPVIIDWVLAQVTEDQIGSDLMKSLNGWKAGTKLPTFNQLELLSSRSRIPLGYFFLENPPVEKLDLIQFRTVDSVELVNPSRNLIDTIYDMEEIQQWMRDYRIDSGYEKLQIVGSLKDYDDVRKIADIIRRDLGLLKDWFNSVNSKESAFHYIRNLIKDTGIIVMLNGIVGKNTHRSLNINEFRAFALVDEWAPLIFINGSDSENAKIFSLFHELVHIWIGVNDLFNDRRYTNSGNKIEVLCNAVASELVLPADVFIDAWSSDVSDDMNERIGKLAHRFKCSRCVIARKAYDKRKITYEDYNEVVEDSIRSFEEYKQSKKSGGNYYANAAYRLDRSFVLAICNSLMSGRTTYTEAFRLTNTTGKTFAEVASKFGGVA